MAEIKESAVDVPATTTQKVYPYTESSKVWIHRAKKKPVLPESGVVGDTARDWQLKIGPSFANGNSGVLLGRTLITQEEEKEYMPSIVGISSTHMEWDKMLNEYWANLLVDIPYDGKCLEVGLVHLSESVQKPINVFEWLLYKYCLKYPQVANDMSLVGMSTKIRFYLFKESEARQAALDVKKLKDKAILLRFKMEEDTEAMQSVIILSGNPLPKAIHEQQLLLSQIAESDPAKFVALGKDKDLLEKAFVERLIRAGLMIRPLNSTLVIYDNNQIGNNLNEAKEWLKQPQNSQVLLALRQQLIEKEK